MTLLENKSTFARRAKVSRPTITRATKPGNELYPALEGMKINVLHPVARNFLKNKGIEAPDGRSLSKHKRGPKKAELPGVEDVPPGVDVGEHIDPDQYMDMPLREIVTRFGTSSTFNEWLKAAKLIEDLRDKRLRNDERENKYIPRDIVEKVMSEFARCFSLQLNDGSKTIASRLNTMSKGGRSVEEMIAFVEDQIGAPIINAKTRINQWLKEKDVEMER